MPRRRRTARERPRRALGVTQPADVQAPAGTPRSGRIRRARSRQAAPLPADGHALKPIHDWDKDFEATWSERLDELDTVLEHLKRQEQEIVQTTTGSAKVTFPSDTEFLITREFAARPRLVYKAWTTPELVERYWAGKRAHGVASSRPPRRRPLALRDGRPAGLRGRVPRRVPRARREPRIVTTEVYEARRRAPRRHSRGRLPRVGSRRDRLELLVQLADKETPPTRSSPPASRARMQEQFDELTSSRSHSPEPGTRGGRVSLGRRDHPARLRQLEVDPPCRSVLGDFPATWIVFPSSRTGP